MIVTRSSVQAVHAQKKAKRNGQAYTGQLFGADLRRSLWASTAQAGATAAGASRANEDAGLSESWGERMAGASVFVIVRPYLFTVLLPSPRRGGVGGGVNT